MAVYLKNRQVLESFTYARDRSIYDTEMTNLNMKNPKKFVNINTQQYIYWELVRLFEAISHSQKRRLRDCTKEIFKPETIINPISDDLNIITDRILAEINKRGDGRYSFRRVNYANYDNIEVLTDPNGNVNYIYDVFVQDPIESFELRLKIDVIKYVDPNAFKERQRIKQSAPITCAVETRPAFPTYPIGYPQPEQMQPLPSQVITPAKLQIGNLGINVFNPLPIKELYINIVRIFNSNLVVNADEICPEKLRNLRGYSDNTLDADECKFWDGPCQIPNKVRNKWPVIRGEVGNPHEKDCDVSDFRWGIHGEQYRPKKACRGMRDPTIQQPFIAEWNPTLYTLPRYSGNYAWLFQLFRGDSRQSTS